jgi:hypothetical protein
MQPFYKNECEVGQKIYSTKGNEITELTLTKKGTKYAYFGEMRYEYGASCLEYKWDGTRWQTTHYFKYVHQTLEEANKELDNIKTAEFIDRRKRKFGTNYGFLLSLLPETLKMIKADIETTLELE